MDLHVREFVSEAGTAVTEVPLIMLHGLFGSSANLQGIGKSLSQLRPVVLPDLRNHGRSAHDQDVSYLAMAEDILTLLDKFGFEQIDLLGHSMGGKVAMWLALNYPDRVNHLIVADIAPVNYPNRFVEIFKAMQGLDLASLDSRQDADLRMSVNLTDQGIRSYLLQNLVKLEGRWQWRINLQALADGIDSIMSFPQTSQEYAKPALFLKGEYSDYIDTQNQAELLHYFPFAQIETVNKAGHWLYAEQPESFVDAVKNFLPSG